MATPGGGETAGALVGRDMLEIGAGIRPVDRCRNGAVGRRLLASGSSGRLLARGPIIESPGSSPWGFLGAGAVLRRTAIITPCRHRQDNSGLVHKRDLQ